MGGLQIRFDIKLPAEDYVSTKAWRDASLEACPNHPGGCCSFARHGTYGRKTPAGARVPRWYCPESHTTFSMLADCLAARTPGTLDAVETAVAAFDEGTGETLSVTGADFTITDDDDAPTVTLVLTPASIKESSSTASETVSTVTATLSAASSQAVSLTVAADFTLSANKTLTIAAGATASTGAVTITAVDNSVDAPAVAITPTGAIALSLFLTVSPDEIEEASGISTIMVSTKDDATFQTDQTITLTLGGTATKGMDYHYTTTRETLTLKAGETFVSTEVMAMQDAIVEDDEMVMISASHNGAEIPSPSSLLSHGTADAFGARLARSIMIMDDDTRSVVVTPTSLTVAESDDATTHGRRENEATYTVVLTSEPTGQVTVSTQSSDEDVATVAPSLLRFTAENWNRPQTVTVSGVDDARINPGDKRETQIMHAVSGGDYAGLTADPVSVRVNDDSGVLVHQAWLTRLGRTVAEQSIAAIRGRIAADRNSGFEGRFAGQPLPGTGAADYPKSNSVSQASPKAGEVVASRTSPGLAADLAEDALPAFRSFLTGDNGGDPEIRELSADDVLLKTSFALARDTGTGTGTIHGFWGRAARSGFEGRDNDTVVDGEVTSVMLGTDWDRKGALFGMALSRSRGTGAYRGASSGAIDARLTSLVPYAGLDTGGRLSIWGAAGLGTGDVTRTPEGMAPATADVRWNMAAAGAEGALTPGTGVDGTELGWHADALWTRIVSEASNGLAPTSGETTRLRLGLRAAWERTLATGVTLGSRLEAGFRHDGGNVETGHGLEIGGGLALADPRRGISVAKSGAFDRQSGDT